MNGKMKNTERLLSMLLAVALVLSVGVFGAFASDIGEGSYNGAESAETVAEIPVEVPAVPAELAESVAETPVDNTPAEGEIPAENASAIEESAEKVALRQQYEYFLTLSEEERASFVESLSAEEYKALMNYALAGQSAETETEAGRWAVLFDAVMEKSPAEIAAEMKVELTEDQNNLTALEILDGVFTEAAGLSDEEKTEFEEEFSDYGKALLAQYADFTEICELLDGMSEEERTAFTAGLSETDLVLIDVVTAEKEAIAEIAEIEAELKAAEEAAAAELKAAEEAAAAEAPEQAATEQEAVADEVPVVTEEAAEEEENVEEIPAETEEIVAEEETAEETPVEAGEEEVPEGMHFEQTVNDGVKDITVIIDAAAGVFEEGTEMVVVAVPFEEALAHYAATLTEDEIPEDAYEVRIFFYLNGVEVSPNGDVSCQVLTSLKEADNYSSFGDFEVVSADAEGGEFML